MNEYSCLIIDPNCGSQRLLNRRSGLWPDPSHHTLKAPIVPNFTFSSNDLNKMTTPSPSVEASYKNLKGTLSVRQTHLEWHPTSGQSSSAPITISIGLIRSPSRSLLNPVSPVLSIRPSGHP